MAHAVAAGESASPTMTPALPDYPFPGKRNRPGPDPGQRPNFSSVVATGYLIV